MTGCSATAPDRAGFHCGGGPAGHTATGRAPSRDDRARGDKGTEPLAKPPLLLSHCLSSPLRSASRAPCPGWSTRPSPGHPGRRHQARMTRARTRACHPAEPCGTSSHNDMSRTAGPPSGCRAWRDTAECAAPAPGAHRSGAGRPPPRARARRCAPRHGWRRAGSLQQGRGVPAPGRGNGLMIAMGTPSRWRSFSLGDPADAPEASGQPVAGCPAQSGGPSRGPPQGRRRRHSIRGRTS